MDWHLSGDAVLFIAPNAAGLPTLTEYQPDSRRQRSLFPVTGYAENLPNFAVEQNASTVYLNRGNLPRRP